MWAGISIGLIAILLFISRKIPFSMLFHLLTIALVVVAVVLPWWGLQGSRSIPESRYDIELLVTPPAMIEQVSQGETQTMTFALIPDIFIQFLDVIVGLCVVSIIILVGSQILRYYHRKAAVVCMLAAIVILLVIVIGFITGMSKVTEISVGSIFGEQTLNVGLDGGSIQMPSRWGLASGFYLLVISSIFSAAAVILFLRKEQLPKLFCK